MCASIDPDDRACMQQVGGQLRVLRCLPHLKATLQEHVGSPPLRTPEEELLTWSHGVGILRAKAALAPGLPDLPEVDTVENSSDRSLHAQSL